jgi:hypothetical protein
MSSITTKEQFGDIDNALHRRVLEARGDVVAMLLEHGACIHYSIKELKARTAAIINLALAPTIHGELSTCAPRIGSDVISNLPLADLIWKEDSEYHGFRVIFAHAVESLFPPLHNLFAWFEAMARNLSEFFIELKTIDVDRTNLANVLATAVHSVLIDKEVSDWLIECIEDEVFNAVIMVVNEAAELPSQEPDFYGALQSRWLTIRDRFTKPYLALAPQMIACVRLVVFLDKFDWNSSSLDGYEKFTSCMSGDYECNLNHFKNMLQRVDSDYFNMQSLCNQRLSSETL